ncbi:hypothetical protein DMN91_001562 [Ooceraea biroi]|uniref:Uncharacterized protein n=1 Tax=Ooceraea biroi TaxID=2015173 RepID=A0A3L8DYH9_OOCBI|nr:extensin-like [Ooceraea biroi]RLU25406.1 hypothetical protein DMN91_001562 [Ooceraea biroi]
MSRREHEQARAVASQAVRPAYSPPKEATSRPPINRPWYPRSRQDKLCAALETPPPPSRPGMRSSRLDSAQSAAPPEHRAPLTPAQFRTEMEALFGQFSDSDFDMDLGVIEEPRPPTPSANPAATGTTQPPPPPTQPLPPPNRARPSTPASTSSAIRGLASPRIPYDVADRLRPEQKYRHRDPKTGQTFLLHRRPQGELIFRPVRRRD